MEHRPLPHHLHSPAIRRYLNEPASLLGRIHTANGSGRVQFYIGAHESQLHTVQQDVSRRETSQTSQFPFLCVFHFAGCDQKFGNRRDWKYHVVSQHLRFDRVFWECNEGFCMHNKRTRWQERLFLQVKDIKALQFQDYNGTLFASIHDFRTHFVHRHRLTKSHDKKEDIAFRPDTEGQWLLDRQDESMRMVCGLPQDLGCPMPQCASVRFTGPAAWDQRLNHAAEHFLASPQCPDVFGGERDTELMCWASCNAISSLEKTTNAPLQQHDCNKSVADSGYSSTPGMPRLPNISQQEDSFPLVPGTVPLWKSDDDRSLGELCESVGIGGWVQDDEYRVTLIDKETNFSTSKSVEQVFSKLESTGDHHTLDTSQDSDSGDESDETPVRNPETAAVMQWSHGWLRQWLAPLSQERPNGNEGRQSTASQSQNSTSTSSSSSRIQNKKGTSRPRRLPKRKRADDDDDEGNEDRSKSQRIDGDSEIRMFACPYFKRNPRKYGQPKWKSCAHPGYPNVHRVKYVPLPAR
ncbi:hypothetical protein F52700_5894 [Fusarium sp. NRRL 52700]|nr:hypothetical protein F52700_5894 [Fusarium sp. NRRL 52700]